jgi:NAD(P)-dependent dehydrogenase (short-subunit alcohol dehydrogenase family)
MMNLPEELQFITNARMPQKTTAARLDGKLCAITGATSGIGLAAAKRIAKAGADLILVCRNAEKGQNVAAELRQDFGINVDIVLADFSDFEQIHRAANEILDKHPKLDILINNAGIHMTKRELTKDGLEIVFAVNHLAPFLFTRLLLERVKESAPARILQINSEGHRFSGVNLNDLKWEKRIYRGIRSYGQAKTAQLLTVWDMADELAESGVTINAMHPGAVQSNIGMNNGWLYRNYQKHLLFPLLKGVDISAEAIYYLVAAPEMKKNSGKFYNLTIEEIPAKHARNRELGKKVWAISEELTGLSGGNHAL